MLFRSIPESAHFWPPLTTVRQEFSQVGERCVSMLIEAIDRSDDPARRPGAAVDATPMVEPKLIVRDSVAPA